MNKKIIAIAALACLCLGSAAVQAQVAGDYGRMVDPAVSPSSTQEWEPVI